MNRKNLIVCLILSMLFSLGAGVNYFVSDAQAGDILSCYDHPDGCAGEDCWAGGTAMGTCRIRNCLDCNCTIQCIVLP